MKSITLDVSKLKVAAIINTSSGGCDSDSEGEMEDVFRDAGVTNRRIWSRKSDQIERAFAELAMFKPDMLVVLGGDGTIRTAAKASAKSDTYLLPLPGGTMNMLPRALYGDLRWQQALRTTLAKPFIKALPGGRTADELFFVAAIAGAPALWMEARESMRDHDVVDAVEKSAAAFQAMFNTKIHYSISPEKSGETEMLAIICPLVSQEMTHSEQAFEAAAIDVQTAGELFGLATAAAFGKWRDNENVTLTKTRHVLVETSGDIPFFFDGERVNVGRKADISFVPDVVNVITPGSESAEQ